MAAQDIKSLVKLANQALIITAFLITRWLLDINLFINQTVEENCFDVYLLNFLVISSSKSEKKNL
jgi:hypothetical protein